MKLFNVLLSAVAITGIVIAGPIAATPAETADQLFVSTGQAYLDLRGTVLTSEPAEFDAVVAELATHGDAGPQLAAALVVRRNATERAAGFDEMVDEVRLNARHTARGVRKPVLLRSGRVLPEEETLAVEHALKRTDLEPSMRWVVLALLPSDDLIQPADIDKLLAVLEVSEHRGGLGCLADHTIRCGMATGDERVVDALVALYNRRRETYPGEDYVAAMIPIAFERWPTETTLAAARAIVENERVRMIAAGFAPWDDPGAQEHYSDLVAAHDAERRAAYNSGHPTTTARHAEMEQAEEKAAARSARRGMWEMITQSVMRLEAALGVAGEP